MHLLLVTDAALSPWDCLVQVAADSTLSGYLLLIDTLIVVGAHLELEDRALGEAAPRSSAHQVH